MAKLVVTASGETRTFELGDEPVVIGRELSCAVSIQDPLASRQHCRVEPSGTGHVLRDLGSSNGTVHNGSRIEEVPLRAGDRIQIGEVRIDYIASPTADAPAAANDVARRVAEAPTPVPDAPGAAPEEPVPTPSAAPVAEAETKPVPPARRTVAAASGPHITVVNGPLEGKSFPLSAGFTVGRKEGCDLVLPDRKSSGEHARIDRQGDRWVVVDLDSGNGLFVGRNRIRKHKLVDGDMLVVGDTRLRVRGLPPDPAASDSSSASQVFRAVDEGEISEDDLSRLRSRNVEETSGLQGLWTGVFVVCFGLILFYGYSMVQSLLGGGGSAVDPENLLGASAGFESPAESGWGEDWAVDTDRGDPATLGPVRGEGLPQGNGALSVSSSGGDRGHVLVTETRTHEVGSGDAFLVAGQFRNEGFDRIGLAVIWYSRKGGELEPIEQTYTSLTDRAIWTRLSGILQPPAWGEPQACRFGFIALGSGSAQIDDLVLKRVPREDSEPFGVAVTAGGIPLRASLDASGVVEAVRDGDRWLRQMRFALADQGGSVPWGQLLPAMVERPKPQENGAVRNKVELDGGRSVTQVSQLTQAVGDRIKVAWTPNPAAGAMLVVELDPAIADARSSLHNGERSVASDIGWAELDDKVGDELGIGSGGDSLILEFGVPGRFGALGREEGRGGPAFTWTPTEPLPGGVLEVFLGTVSDRERRRIDELWSEVASAQEAREEGRALSILTTIEREFPWRDDVVERARTERTRILTAAERAWEELQSVRSDLRRHPESPIGGYLEGRATEFAARFEGTPFADRARSLAEETRDAAVGRQADVEQERKQEILQVADGYYQGGRDAVARFYYDWLVREHDGTPEAETARHRLDLIEARSGGSR